MSNETTQSDSAPAGLPVWIKTMIGVVTFAGLLAAMVWGTEIFKPQVTVNESQLAWDSMSPSQKTDNAFDNGEWPIAINGYRRMLKEDAFNARAMFRLGYCLHRTNQFDEALEQYEKAGKFFQFRDYVRYNSACIYALTDRHEKALESLDMALKEGFTTRFGIDNDLDFESIRDSEKFKELIAVETKTKERNRRSRRR